MDEWQLIEDPQGNYYYNSTTGEARWEPPTFIEAAPSGTADRDSAPEAVALLPASAEGASAIASEELVLSTSDDPTGAVAPTTSLSAYAVWSEADQAYYYVDPVTGESSWDPPGGAAESDETANGWAEHDVAFSDAANAAVPSNAHALASNDLDVYHEKAEQENRSEWASEFDSSNALNSAARDDSIGAGTWNYTEHHDAGFDQEMLPSVPEEWSMLAAPASDDPGTLLEERYAVTELAREETALTFVAPGGEEDVAALAERQKWGYALSRTASRVGAASALSLDDLVRLDKSVPGHWPVTRHIFRHALEDYRDLCAAAAAGVTLKPKGTSALVRRLVGAEPGEDDEDELALSSSSEAEREREAALGEEHPALSISPWVRAQAPDGNSYYVNAETGESTWDTPVRPWEIRAAQLALLTPRGAADAGRGSWRVREDQWMRRRREREREAAEKALVAAELGPRAPLTDQEEVAAVVEGLVAALEAAANAVEKERRRQERSSWHPSTAGFPMTRLEVPTASAGALGSKMATNGNRTLSSRPAAAAVAFDGLALLTDAPFVDARLTCAGEMLPRFLKKKSALLQPDVNVHETLNPAALGQSGSKGDAATAVQWLWKFKEPLVDVIRRKRRRRPRRLSASAPLGELQWRVQRFVGREHATTAPKAEGADAEGDRAAHPPLLSRQSALSLTRRSKQKAGRVGMLPQAGSAGADLTVSGATDADQQPGASSVATSGNDGQHGTSAESHNTGTANPGSRASTSDGKAHDAPVRKKFRAEARATLAPLAAALVRGGRSAAVYAGQRMQEGVENLGVLADSLPPLAPLLHHHLPRRNAGVTPASLWLRSFEPHVEHGKRFAVAAGRKRHTVMRLARRTFTSRDTAAGKRAAEAAAAAMAAQAEADAEAAGAEMRRKLAEPVFSPRLVACEPPPDTSTLTLVLCGRPPPALLPKTVYDRVGEHGRVEPRTVLSSSLRDHWETLLRADVARAGGVAIEQVLIEEVRVCGATAPAARQEALERSVVNAHNALAADLAEEEAFTTGGCSAPDGSVKLRQTSELSDSNIAEDSTTSEAADSNTSNGGSILRRERLSGEVSASMAGEEPKVQQNSVSEMPTMQAQACSTERRSAAAGREESEGSSNNSASSSGQQGVHKHALLDAAAATGPVEKNRLPDTENTLAMPEERGEAETGSKDALAAQSHGFATKLASEAEEVGHFPKESSSTKGPSDTSSKRSVAPAAEPFKPSNNDAAKLAVSALSKRKLLRAVLQRSSRRYVTALSKRLFHPEEADAELQQAGREAVEALQRLQPGMLSWEAKALLLRAEQPLLQLPTISELNHKYEAERASWLFEYFSKPSAGKLGPTPQAAIGNSEAAVNLKEAKSETPKSTVVLTILGRPGDTGGLTRQQQDSKSPSECVAESICSQAFILPRKAVEEATVATVGMLTAAQGSMEDEHAAAAAAAAAATAALIEAQRSSLLLRGALTHAVLNASWKPAGRAIALESWEASWCHSISPVFFGRRAFKFGQSSVGSACHNNAAASLFNGADGAMTKMTVAGADTLGRTATISTSGSIELGFVPGLSAAEQLERAEVRLQALLAQGVMPDGKLTPQQYAAQKSRDLAIQQLLLRRKAKARELKRFTSAQHGADTAATLPNFERVPDEKVREWLQEIANDHAVRLKEARAKAMAERKAHRELTVARNRRNALKTWLVRRLVAGAAGGQPEEVRRAAAVLAAQDDSSVRSEGTSDSRTRAKGSKVYDSKFVSSGTGLAEESLRAAGYRKEVTAGAIARRDELRTARKRREAENDRDLRAIYRSAAAAVPRSSVAISTSRAALMPVRAAAAAAAGTAAPHSAAPTSPLEPLDTANAALATAQTAATVPRMDSRSTTSSKASSRAVLTAAELLRRIGEDRPLTARAMRCPATAIMLTRPEFSRAFVESRFPLSEGQARRQSEFTATSAAPPTSVKGGAVSEDDFALFGCIVAEVAEWHRRFETALDREAAAAEGRAEQWRSKKLEAADRRNQRRRHSVGRSGLLDDKETSDQTSRTIGEAGKAVDVERDRQWSRNHHHLLIRAGDPEHGHRSTIRQEKGEAAFRGWLEGLDELDAGSFRRRGTDVVVPAESNALAKPGKAPVHPSEASAVPMRQLQASHLQHRSDGQLYCVVCRRRRWEQRRAERLGAETAWRNCWEETLMEKAEALETAVASDVAIVLWKERAGSEECVEDVVAQQAASLTMESLIPQVERKAARELAAEAAAAAAAAAAAPDGSIETKVAANVGLGVTHAEGSPASEQGTAVEAAAAAVGGAGDSDLNTAPDGNAAHVGPASAKPNSITEDTRTTSTKPGKHGADTASVPGRRVSAEGRNSRLTTRGSDRSISEPAGLEEGEGELGQGAVDAFALCTEAHGNAGNGSHSAVPVSPQAAESTEWHCTRVLELREAEVRSAAAWPRLRQLWLEAHGTTQEQRRLAVSTLLAELVEPARYRWNTAEANRRAMVREEEITRRGLETTLRAAERPATLAQESGRRHFQAAMLSLRAPHPNLQRLRWERGEAPDAGGITAQVRDAATGERFLCRFVACPTEEAAALVVEEALRILENRHIGLVRVKDVFRHAIATHVAATGRAATRWLAVVLVMEFCEGGRLIARADFLAENVRSTRIAAAEASSLAAEASAAADSCRLASASAADDITQQYEKHRGLMAELAAATRREQSARYSGELAAAAAARAAAERAAALAAWVRQVAAGLARLHRANGFHGALSASCVYLDRHGIAKIGGYWWLEGPKCLSVRDAYETHESATAGPEKTFAEHNSGAAVVAKRTTALGCGNEPVSEGKSERQRMLEAEDVRQLGRCIYRWAAGHELWVPDSGGGGGGVSERRWLDRVIRQVPQSAGAACRRAIRLCLEPNAAERLTAEGVWRAVSASGAWKPSS